MPGGRDGYETLFKAADEAMYLDKEQSKNRNESREAGEEKQDKDNIMTQQEEQDMKHGWGSVILSGGQGRRMGGG